MGLEANWRTELSIVSKKYIIMQSCFCFSIFVFLKHTKRQSDARDAPIDNTGGVMVKTIQIKLSRSGGGGGYDSRQS